MCWEIIFIHGGNNKQWNILCVSEYIIDNNNLKKKHFETWYIAKGDKREKEREMEREEVVPAVPIVVLEYIKAQKEN